METIILKTYTHKDLELRIAKISKGYSVVMFDLEVNKALPVLRIYDTEEKAIVYAEDVYKDLLNTY